MGDSLSHLNDLLPSFTLKTQLFLVLIFFVTGDTSYMGTVVGIHDIPT